MKYIFVLFLTTTFILSIATQSSGQTSPTITPEITSNTPSPTVSETPTVTQAPTVSPSSTATPSETPKPTDSDKKKAVLGGTDQMGKTGFGQDMVKWILVSVGGITVILFGFKLARSHGEEE